MIFPKVLSHLFYIIFRLASLQNKIITRQLAYCNCKGVLCSTLKPLAVWRLWRLISAVECVERERVEVAFCECEFRRKQVAQWGRGAS